MICTPPSDLKGATRCYGWTAGGLRPALTSDTLEQWGWLSVRGLTGQARGVRKLRTNYGPRPPNSAHVYAQQWTPTRCHSTLSDRWGPIWESRGREFKSRQPDRAKCLVRRQNYLSKYFCFMIVFAVDHLF
jgi:hypothetical protein